MSKNGVFRIKGWHVLAGLIAFFGVVIGVNTVFIVKATKTFPGMSVEHPYEKGLRYNLTIAQREQAEVQNWQASLQINEANQLIARIVNANGPVDGLEVKINLVWPGLPHLDQKITLLPGGPGTYLASLDGIERPKERKVVLIGRAIWPNTDWAFTFDGQL